MWRRRKYHRRPTSMWRHCSSKLHSTRKARRGAGPNFLPSMHHGPTNAAINGPRPIKSSTVTHSVRAAKIALTLTEEHIVRGRDSPRRYELTRYRWKTAKVRNALIASGLTAIRGFASASDRVITVILHLACQQIVCAVRPTFLGSAPYCSKSSHHYRILEVSGRVAVMD